MSDASQFQSGQILRFPSTTKCELGKAPLILSGTNRNKQQLNIWAINKMKHVIAMLNVQSSTIKFRLFTTNHWDPYNRQTTCSPSSMRRKSQPQACFINHFFINDLYGKFEKCLCNYYRIKFWCTNYFTINLKEICFVNQFALWIVARPYWSGN